MTKVNIMFYAVIAAATVVCIVNSTPVYEPINKNGSITVIRQRETQLPPYEHLYREAESSRTLYDPNNIEATGWTAKNLEFINTKKFDGNEIICRNCAANRNEELEISDIPGFGKCIGGFCEYQNSNCYYNILQNYWYKCIPEEFNYKNLTTNEKQKLKKKDTECDFLKSVEPFTVTTAPGAVKYNPNNVIALPCTTDGFDIDLDVVTQDDLYIMLSDNDGYNPSDNVKEIAFKFSTGVFETNNKVVSQSFYSNVSPNLTKAFSSRIRIMYTGYFLNVYVNNDSKPSYDIQSKQFKGLYLAPKAGKVDVTFGLLGCQSSIGCQTSVESTPISSTTALPAPTSSTVPPTPPSDKCDFSKSIEPFSVIAAPGAVKYDANNVITLPCTTVDVDIELNVDTQDDLYIMLTGNDSYSPSENVIEIALKFSSKVYEINEDVLAQSSYTTASPGSNKSFVGKIRVIYNGYFVGVYINDVGKASYIIENSEFKGMYVAPSAGKVEVSKGFLNIQCSNGCQASVDSSSLYSSSTSSMSFFELFSASPFISFQISVDSTFSSHTCDYTSSFMNLSITSSPNIKIYDFNAPILVPCSNSDFQLDFDLVSDSDLFVAITDLAGFSSSFGYSESSFGFSSGNYLI
ncbi:hypothetical protein AYI70_g8678 [Smittium culicis]|uniref:Uncharacterized protein n=1 Tax=Smittium culicis TaxID=133412 RepID=A0A1R1XEV4_9FUNG|nr:hypothetical protein AYI70_g8678 [Smittium culicis]